MLNLPYKLRSALRDRNKILL